MTSDPMPSARVVCEAKFREAYRLYFSAEAAGKPVIRRVPGLSGMMEVIALESPTCPLLSTARFILFGAGLDEDLGIVCGATEENDEERVVPCSYVVLELPDRPNASTFADLSQDDLYGAECYTIDVDGEVWAPYGETAGRHNRHHDLSARLGDAQLVAEMPAHLVIGQ